MSQPVHNWLISLKTNIISLASTPFKFSYEGTAQTLETPFTVKADYYLLFIFDLSLLVFIHHITLTPQQLFFFKILFERVSVMIFLESQAIWTGSALFLSVKWLKKFNEFQGHGSPLKNHSTCAVARVRSIQMGQSVAIRKWNVILITLQNCWEGVGGSLF